MNSIIDNLTKWQDLSDDDKHTCADAIWGSIQSIKNVSDETMVDCLIGQIAKSKSVGPVFFYERDPKNIVNGKDYTDAFNDIGIWVMGYAISSNQYFKNVDGASCKTKLIPTFQNKELAANLFLDYLYDIGGFAAFLKYDERATKTAVLDLILSPNFIQLAYWQNSLNLFPLQVLLLVAKDLGCDLTEVRKMVQSNNNITPTVFDMADGIYNFFQNFLQTPSIFCDYLDSNKNMQYGLPGTRPSPAGVSLCNVEIEVWGETYFKHLYMGVADYYQNYNGLFGVKVDQWILETTDLPHSSPSTNIRQLGDSFLGSGDSIGIIAHPVGSPVDPSTIKSSCFPGDAQVILLTWKQAPIWSLRHGDRVLTVNKMGQYHFSEIFFFGHRDYSIVAEFQRIQIEGGRCLHLSAGHYLPVSDTTSWSDRRFARSRDVLVGQLVWVVSEGLDIQELQPSRVISVDVCNRIGLFNPYTLDNSNIIVDNVLASTHSDWFLESIVPNSWANYIPPIYDVCLIPGKLIYRLMGSSWAATFQNEIEIDKAAYAETGFKALVKPYMILTRKVIASIMKNIWKRIYVRDAPAKAKTLTV